MSIKKIIGYSHSWEAHFTGVGDTQGNGIDIQVRRLRVFGLSFITDVKFTGEPSWLDKRIPYILAPNQKKDE